jgi:glycosyltransferase involved in cell wall biosynthesis
VIKGLTDEILKKKIVDCGAESVAHRIHRVGYIDYADLPLLYQGASMLWFPSFNEGFGLPIVEAMAGGTPVITSNLSVMPEIAGDAALYIDPYQPEQLADKSHLLLSDDVLRKELIQKGETIASRFTWKSSVNDLLKVYRKLIA